ncbi:hypothetical protein HYH03_018908 [Edaphochlamys debaryana]|uniref:EGF-like domain-containing protein n=1 Tax=Edaphochlamys debaryana TaxID=47281 RepID=A0A835XKX3_9CHLO|nr:hypothetical protein HYH03_018908 [Edaphochlamys debaryana]|eukprot:KAG2482149.1 hypothetical protein HYH03_018908 [Edaphochlamys debaryana]
MAGKDASWSFSRGRSLLVVIAAFSLWAQSSAEDDFERFWGLRLGRAPQRSGRGGGAGGGGPQGPDGGGGGGRRLLHRDLKYEEIFLYWQRMYGNWSREDHEEHVATFKHQLQSGPEGAGAWERPPSSDAAFLAAYYFLRGRSRAALGARAAPGWSPERDRCPPGCTEHGTCHQGEGRCDCPRGRTGPDCSQPLASSCGDWCLREGQCHRIIREWCVNECNQRGVCVYGFCHCFAGYYGAGMDWDASPAPRPVLLQGLGYEPNPRGPKIYVYEFPPQFNVWGHLWIDRPNNLILWERILSLRLRTLDPEEADFFFVPGCRRGCNLWRGKFEYILKHYGRYWERRGGRDNLVTSVGDWGRCEAPWPLLGGRALDTAQGAGGTGGNASGPSASASPLDVAPLLERVTMLTHWGISADRSGEVSDNLFKACHKPNQDLVIPPLVGDMFGAYEWSVWHPKRRITPIQKTVLASVAGSLCGWNSAEDPPCKNRRYSFGVRAALWQLLRDTPDFQVVKRVPNMARAMAESEFCFAPTGAGYGKRNVISATLGCMPVIISDHVAQPWEPFLDWGSFGAWIPEADMNATEAVLRAFTAEEKADKMRRLHCAALHLTWSSVFGAVAAGDSGGWDAVGTLVWVLRARARNPGVEDSRLRAVDPEFDAFMDCRTGPTPSPGGAGAGAGGAGAGGETAAPARSPPMPSSAHAALLRPAAAAAEAAAFPRRTFATAAWARARAAAAAAAAGGAGGGGGGVGIALPGLGSDPRAGATEAAPGEGVEWVVLPGGLNVSAPLCLFSPTALAYADPGAPLVDVGALRRSHPPGDCLPRNANRAGAFHAGGSATCAPGEPLTACAVLA